MPTLPGGKIISGVGGRLWISPIKLGADHDDLVPKRAIFDDIDGSTPKSNTEGLDPDANPPPGYGVNPPFLDVLQWSITRTRILAEVPHSGCVGGVTRRVIGVTWRFSASLPLDQDYFPESLLKADRFAIAFYLGDVSINSEAIYMDMDQAYYFSPRAVIHQINPILNASGDVIRVNITGEESSRLFLIPTESDLCDRYVDYVNKHKGWL